MALIRCPECGREISGRAERCIHCGYPLSAPVRRRQPLPRTGWLVVLFMVLLEALSLGAFRNPPPRVTLPWGLETGMSIGRIMQQMEEQGFCYTHEMQQEGYRVLFFDAAQVQGRRAEFISVRLGAEGGVDVGAFFGETGDHGRGKPSEDFAALRLRLIKAYGEPQLDDIGDVVWEDGSCRLSLSYTGNTGGELWLTWSGSP